MEISGKRRLCTHRHQSLLPPLTKLQLPSCSSSLLGAISFILAANIIAGGPFDGASMNLARTFGPSLIVWRWNNHWIYWVGPFTGAGLAGFLYEFLVIPAESGAPKTHQPLAPEEYQEWL